MSVLHHCSHWERHRFSKRVTWQRLACKKKKSGRRSRELSVRSASPFNGRRAPRLQSRSSVCFVWSVAVPRCPRSLFLHASATEIKIHQPVTAESGYLGHFCERNEAPARLTDCRRWNQGVNILVLCGACMQFFCGGTACVRCVWVAKESRMGRISWRLVVYQNV